MDFVHYSDDTVQIAVDLVNSYEVFDGIEHLDDVDDLAEFFATRCSACDPPDFDLGDRDLDEVHALRGDLRRVFSARDERDAAAVLNEILADVVATPRVSVHGSGPHLHFVPADVTPARWLGAVTAVALSVALIDGGLARIGVCGAKGCDDVFVDTSRNRSRRYCSETCTTRENVAAFRARQTRTPTRTPEGLSRTEPADKDGT